MEEIVETSKKEEPKKVAYLFGAGATQAEVSLIDNTIRLLMNDVREGILKKIDRDEELKRKLLDVINLLKERSDIEHLITLYESSGTAHHSDIAQLLKKLFREEIQERLKKLGPNFAPTLYTALIDMHELESFNEEIIGVMTLNYEDLLERGMQIIKEEIDYAIQTNNEHSRLKTGEKSGYPLLKLHGSFNWKNGFPVTLVDDEKIEDEDVLWIPPGVEKKRDRYPFSILWGKAMEVLNCDVLRVIGCSLNRNDWQLVSLLHTTQKLNANKKEYSIELIDYLNQCDIIKENYSYLSFRTISDILEVREFITRSLGVKEEDKKSKAIEESLKNEKLNIFDTWLRSKGEFLRERMSIATKTGFFEKYLTGRI